MDQQTVIYQWAVDAVREMREVWRRTDGMTEEVADRLYAAIISRHAIEAGMSEQAGQAQ